MKYSSRFLTNFIAIASFVAIIFVPHISYAKSLCSTISDHDESYYADHQDELNAIYADCDKKQSEAAAKGATLSSEITYMDNQLNLTQARIQNSISKIAKTKLDIDKLANNITEIKGRLVKLEDSIAYQKKVLDARLRSRYKIHEASPIIVLLGSSTVNEIVQKAEYLQHMEVQDNKMLTEMDKTKTAFNKQQNIFQDKKDETESLKMSLEKEKTSLDSYKASLQDQQEEKRRLLEITQNDEAKYQKLLDEASKQLAAFSSFTSNAGGGVVGSGQFGPGKEGWYLSQRDSAWANKHIGKSNETILDVGCLLTSIAMVYRKYGLNASPWDIARDSSRFFSDTALMLIPWKGPAGKSYTSLSVSQIDGELAAGRPVITGIYAGAFGTHFVVLSKKSGADYIMYDPWYGPDLKFSSHYNKGSIFQAVVFK